MPEPVESSASRAKRLGAPASRRPVGSESGNESAACDVCGKFGAVEIGERVLCTDCYGQTCGSCCPEFGREAESD